MAKNLALVLVPGAGMGDWIWEPAKNALGIPSVSIAQRLPVNTYQTRRRATLGDCVGHIQTQLDQSPFEKFIVEDHSGAGPLAAKLCQAMAGRIVQTMVDSQPFVFRFINILAVRKMIRKDSPPFRNLEKMVRERFRNDSSEEMTKDMLSRSMNSEPLCALTEKMDWENFPPVPQTYLVLLKDRTLSVDRQRSMASNLGINAGSF